MQLIDTEYNTLQTITVLGKEKPDGSAISALQPSEDASEFPYIKLRSSPSAIVLRGWTPTDLSLYVPNGYVSVEVKDTNGGERLEVGFEEMKNGQSVSVTKILDTEITSEWKIVHNVVNGNVPERTVVSAVKLVLIHHFLCGLPLRAVKINDLVDRLISSSQNAVGVILCVNGEQVGRVTGCDSGTELIVTLCVHDLRILKNPAFTFGIVALCGNAVCILEQNSTGRGLVDIIMTRPFYALCYFKIGVLQTVCDLCDSVINALIFCESSSCRGCR